MSDESRYRAAAAIDPATPGAAARLLEYLGDPSWRVRAVAAERMGGVPDPRPALPGLLEALCAGNGAAARGAAAAALAALGAAALAALLPRLADPSPEVRSALVELLGEIRDPRAVRALEGALSDPDVNVRTAAAEGLGKVGGARAARVLAGTLATADRPLLLAALEALERMSAAPPMDRLAPLLGDPLLGRPGRRLLGFSDDEAVPELLASAIARGTQSGREAALAAVARQRMRRPASELEPLARAVRDALPARAGWIAEAVASEDRGVAAGALLVLGWLKDAARARDAAAAAADEELRPLALEALEAMGPEAARALERDLSGFVPEVRAFVSAARSRIGDASRAPRPSMTSEDFRLLRDEVQAHCGILLRDEARLLVERRLAPRIRALGLAGFGDYTRHLRSGAGRAELEAAAELLATHETYFFREPEVLRAFSQEILPEVEGQNARERRLHIWSAGCSTGEEVYTVAILVAESGLFEGWDVSIFGSDIARQGLAAARAGVYGEQAFRAPEAERIRRWFRPEGDRWVVAEPIRRLVRFSYVNLLDPSAGDLLARADLIFCRNVLIYFDLPERRRVVNLFHRKLVDGGYLLLGNSESLLNVTADFELVQLRHDLVYRKPALAE